MQSLDDFLRTSLKGYKVPPSVSERDKFLKEVGIVSGKSGYKRKWLYAAILGGAMIIAGLIVYLSLPPNSLTGTRSASENQSQVIVPKSVIKPRTVDRKPSAPAQQSPSVLLTKSPAKSPQHQNSVVAEQTKSPLPLSASTPMRESTSLTPLTAHTHTFQLVFVSINDPGSIETVDNGVKNLLPDLSDSLENIKTSDKSNEKSTEIHQENRGFALGVYYEPEWMFNLLKEDKNMMVNNFGLKGEYHLGPWSIGTGIGLSVTKGTNEILIGYNTYLGKHRGLDSITFMWNAYHSHLVPTYYYSLKEYYDKEVTVEEVCLNRSYLYLQIPLILGYDFLRKDKFKLGVRIVPTLSVLLQTTPKIDGVIHGNDRIVQINDITPDRIETNYQLKAGIAAGFRLSRWFDMEAEPDIAYYFNSVYEKQGGVKKPWSAGIKISLMVK